MTRYDCKYTSKIFSELSATPKMLIIVKRCFSISRKFSKKFDLIIKPLDFIVQVYIDADYTGDQDNDKSTTGIISLFGGVLIPLQSIKQS